MNVRNVYRNLVCMVVLFLSLNGYSQNPNDFRNPVFLKKLYKDSNYVNQKRKVISTFMHVKPGRWGEFVKGVDEELITKQKYIAFTFDGCGGKLSSRGYNEKLINYLKKENIPATLFVTGLWIDENFQTFLKLSKDTLFEIENHGFNHRPCAIDGESKYGIQGTLNAGQAFDEIEANELKIEALTHRRPLFYRSATAFIDEAGVRLASELGVTTISFQVLSGDAIPFTPPQVIAENVLKDVVPGAIVIMHFNHPQWFECEAMERIIPELRKRGYHFVHLEYFKLKSDKK